jgi:hypothetical protein
MLIREQKILSPSQNCFRKVVKIDLLSSLSIRLLAFRACKCWVGSPQNTLITAVSLITTVTWGIPSHEENCEIIGTIHKGQRSDSWQSNKIHKFTPHKQLCQKKCGMEQSFFNKQYKIFFHNMKWHSLELKEMFVQKKGLILLRTNVTLQPTQIATFLSPNERNKLSCNQLTEQNSWEAYSTFN